MSSSLICPSCSYTVAITAARFCPVCGTPLVSGSTQDSYRPGIVAPVEHEVVEDEVLGWRAWDVFNGLPKLPRLGSVSHKYVWPTDHYTVATCGGHNFCELSSDGRVPGERHSCGIYSARDFEHLTRHLPYAQYRAATGGGVHTKVIGQIAMAGKVIEGTQGWKAEKARIVKLYVPFEGYSRNARMYQRLAEQYNVEIEQLRWIGR